MVKSTFKAFHEFKKLGFFGNLENSILGAPGGGLAAAGLPGVFRSGFPQTEVSGVSAGGPARAPEWITINKNPPQDLSDRVSGA